MLILDKQLAQFHELGYFVTDVMFAMDELAEAIAEFDRLHQEQVAAAEDLGDPRTVELARFRPFIGQAHTKSKTIARLIRAPIYLDACRALIGPDADLYYNQCVIKPPEKGMSFDWHQDSGYQVTRPLEYITCWTAIADTTLENGCIWVLPRSHNAGLVEHKWSAERNSYFPPGIDETTAIPVEMKAGQVAIFSSLTLHKSGPNTSKSTRYGFVPQYHVPQVVRVSDGKPFGDLYPVLRDGQCVAA